MASAISSAASTSLDTDKRRSKSGTSGRKTRKRNYVKSEFTSIRIFRKYLNQRPDGTIDASGIISVDCYQAWLASRKKETLHPEKAFQRALTGHITGVDGRSPFAPEEEKAVLHTLRQKGRWPCFQNSTTKFGELGFRTQGYHERIAAGDVDDSRNKPTEDGEIYPDSDYSFFEDESLIESLVESLVESETMPPPTFSVKRARTGPRSSKVNIGEYEDSRDVLIDEMVPSSPLSVATYSTPPASIQMLPAMELPPIAETGGRMGHVNTLMGGLASMIRSVYDLAHLWTMAHGFVRLRLLTRGWLASPTYEQAESVVRRVKERFPDNYVILFDYTTRYFKDKIMLQDELSVQYFGGISRLHGGFTGARFLPDDTYQVFRTISHAYTYPGHDFPIRVRWKLAPGPFQRAHGTGHPPTAWFDTYYHVDEDNRLLVERGRLSVD